MSTPKGAQIQQPVEDAGAQGQVWLAVRFRGLKSCWVLCWGGAAVRGFGCDASGADDERERRALSGDERESDACSGTAASWVPHEKIWGASEPFAEAAGSEEVGAWRCTRGA